jgi:hypothetical protein
MCGTERDPKTSYNSEIKYFSKNLLLNMVHKSSRILVEQGSSNMDA